MSASRLAQFDLRQLIRHLLFALVVGIVGAFAVIGLVLFTNFGFQLLATYPWLLYLLPAFTLITCGFYRLFHLDIHSTITSLIETMRTDRSQKVSEGFGMAAGTFLSIIGGASVDRTCAALSLGASIGDGFRRVFKLETLRRTEAATFDEHHESLADHYLDDLTPLIDGDPAEVFGKDTSAPKEPCDARHRGIHSYAVATGMVATFSALFFAPIGATLLVIELGAFRRPIRRHVVSFLIAAFAAATINHFIHIGNTVPPINEIVLSWHTVGLALVIGVASALGGMLFVKLMKLAHHETRKRSVPIEVWVIIGSVATIVLIQCCGWQSFLGSGADQLHQAFAGRAGSWDFAIKGLLTLVALGLWLKGGEVGPTLVTGALLGSSCTVLVGGDPSLAAALGMIGLFSAVLRCPLASIFIACEAFGWAGFPLYFITVFIANIIGRDLGLYGEGTFTRIRQVLDQTRQRRQEKTEG